MANHPSKKRQKQAIKEQVRSWEKNKAGKSRYEQLIAPIGRDSEMGRKTMWTKEHHPYIGPGYRAKPTYPTKKALNQSRAREINELVITKINESWNKTQELAVRNEKIARSASLSTHVPFHNTQSELFAARALQPVGARSGARGCSWHEEVELTTLRGACAACLGALGGWRGGSIAVGV